MRDGRTAFALSFAPKGLPILAQRLPTDKSVGYFRKSCRTETLGLSRIFFCCVWPQGSPAGQPWALFRNPVGILLVVRPCSRSVTRSGPDSRSSRSKHRIVFRTVPPLISTSSFGFDSSFVIRHLSFVIFPPAIVRINSSK